MGSVLLLITVGSTTAISSPVSQFVQWQRGSDFEQVFKTPHKVEAGCFSCVDKSKWGWPTAIWLKMTGFKCCSVRKLSQHHLLNLIWELASLAAFLFLFWPCQGLRGMASGGVMGRDRDDDPSWYRALGSLASGASGPSKEWCFRQWLQCLSCRTGWEGEVAPFSCLNKIFCDLLSYKVKRHLLCGHITE